MKTISIISIIAALCLTSCRIVPTAQELKTADHGLPPASTTGYASWILERLDDPSTAIVTHGTLTRGFTRLSDKRPLFGWVLPFAVSEKNIFGGHSEPKTYKAFYKDGRLVAVLAPFQYYALKAKIGDVRWCPILERSGPVRKF
jgi:hypothetical protein